MKDYSNHTNQLLSLFPQLQDEIFNFDNDPHYLEFEKVFDFYTVTLKENAFYGIQPCFLFFRKDPSINAKSARASNKYLVAINEGTITQLNKRFKKLQTKKVLNLISLDTSKLGTTVNTLMLQFCYHFTFYHEMGHLVQKSKYLENGLYEVPINKGPYDERRHLLELDADAFSAISLSAHVIQLFEDNYGIDNKQNLIDILILISCTAFNYVLTFNSANEPFYTYNSTHPHPIIRISYIIENILSYAVQKYGTNVLTGEIKKEIKLKAIALSRVLFSPKIIDTYISVSLANQKEIESYISHFHDLAEGDETLALAKWNAGIDANGKEF